MACIATPSLQQREVSIPGGGTGTRVATALSASSTELLDEASSLVQELSLPYFSEFRNALVSSEKQHRAADLFNSTVL